MPVSDYQMEWHLRHYPTHNDYRQAYGRSTFPHPLVTIDWTKNSEPMSITAVGPAIFKVADAIAPGGSDDSIVSRLIQSYQDQ